IETNIESYLIDKRVFKPAKEFAKKARIKSLAQYQKIYRESIRRPETFWAREAKELTWRKPWKKVLDWRAPFAKWFIGGQLNLSENCLDRHLDSPRRNKAAIIWEGEPGEQRTLTYNQLHREVCRFANVLKRAGVVRGDRVALYMPLVPELAIAMLACARIGAPHSVIFCGFSADALKDRINDAGCKVVVTADGAFRRGTEVRLKPAVDEALKHTPTIEACIVVRRTGSNVRMQLGRDHWWHEWMEAAA